MAGQPGLFDLEERYGVLSAASDPLERLTAVVDFERFRGKPMPAHLARGNAARARVRVAVEHVFAVQKCRLLIRSIDLARAKTKLGFANLVTNMRRLIWFETRMAPA